MVTVVQPFVRNAWQAAALQKRARMGWPVLACIPDSQDAGKAQRPGSFPWLDEVKGRQKGRTHEDSGLKVTRTLPNPVEGLRS